MVTKPRSITQTIPITSVLNRLKTRNMPAITQTIPQSSTVSRQTIKSRIITQTIPITSVLSRVVTKFRTITQTIPISDFARLPVFVNMVISQSRSIVENLEIHKLTPLIISETRNVTDSLSRFVKKFRQIEQVIQINDKLDFIPLFDWVVAGRIRDFPDKPRNLLIDYITAQWSISNPAINTNLQSNVTIGDKEYDRFRTYYIRLTEYKALVDNRIRENLYAFHQPIDIEFTARRLKKGEAFTELSNMINEVIRNFIMYEKEEVFGIQGVSFESLTPLGNDTASKTIWQRTLRINIHFQKVRTS